MRHLFVIDPLDQIKPLKDSTAALMQATQRASIEVWACTPADLQARGDEGWVSAMHVITEPWVSKKEQRNMPLIDFECIWMRKDPPVDEVYLYATHLLELAERNGVKVVNKPSSLRAWNEKLGSLRFSTLMAPTLVASRVEQLANFAKEQKEIVLKPIGGRAGQGVIRINSEAPGLEALLELVTDQERLPIMAQRFLPAVVEGDKRILLVNGEVLGAINRRPKSGDFRSNLAVGGNPEPTQLTKKEQLICDQLSPVLKQHGLFFVGIDVIGEILSEINVTSPTGIREAELFMESPLADHVIKSLINTLR